MRSNEVQWESHVSGGLPVLVEATVHPSEPDVGCFGPIVQDIQVFFLPRKRGKMWPVPEKRITNADLVRLEEEAIENLPQPGDYGEC